MSAIIATLRIKLTEKQAQRIRGWKTRSAKAAGLEGFAIIGQTVTQCPGLPVANLKPARFELAMITPDLYEKINAHLIAAEKPKPKDDL